MFENAKGLLLKTTTAGFPDAPWVLVFLALVFIYLQLVIRELSLTIGTDAATYILLAKGMAAGRGYVDVSVPGSPAHTQYPPFFPLMLTPVFYLFGFNFAWMRLIEIFSGLACVYTVKKLFEKGQDRGLAVVCAAITGTNIYFMLFMREILTEVPYSFLSFYSLYVFERWQKDGWKGRSAAVFFLVVTAAYLTRTIGVTLCFAAIAHILFSFSGDGHDKKKAKRLFLISAASLMPFAVWSLRNTILSSGVSTYTAIFFQADYYSADAGSLTMNLVVSRLRENLGLYMEAVTKVFAVSSMLKGIIPGTLLHLMNWTILLTVLTGFFHELYSKKGVKDFYFLFYLSVLAVWQVDSLGNAVRYIVPLMPLFYYYLFAGTSLVAGLISGLARPEYRRRLKIYALLPCLLFPAVNLVEIRELFLPTAAVKRLSGGLGLLRDGLVKKAEAVSPEDVAYGHFLKTKPCYAGYIAGAFYLKGILRKDDVVLARKPDMVSLVTGGYAVRFPYTADDGAMEKFIEENGVTFILVDACYEETRRFLAPFISKRRDRFHTLSDDANGTALLRYTGKR